MNEIYWITRLDIILITSIAISVATFAIMLFVGIGCIVDAEELLGSNEQRKNILRKGLITLAIVAPIWIFVPDSKTALMIFGIGSTVDYIKENDTIKELPDKCVKALDVWVESLSEEEK